MMDHSYFFIFSLISKLHVICLDWFKIKIHEYTIKKLLTKAGHFLLLVINKNNISCVMTLLELNEEIKISVYINFFF